MAPSEESILSNFLLSPASLPTIVPLQKFTELFPKRLQSHPQIKVLYRELQEMRSQDMDLVHENIKAEVIRARSQKAELQKAWRNTGVDGISDNQQRELEIDVHLFGEASNTQHGDCYTLSSLLSEMEDACSVLQREITTTEDDASIVLAELKAIVNNMSDLRYGKFEKPTGIKTDVVSDALRGLRTLEDACNRAGQS